MKKRTLAVGSLLAVTAIVFVGTATLLGQDHARYSSDEWALDRMGAIPDNPIAETPQPDPSELGGPLAPSPTVQGEPSDDAEPLRIEGVENAHTLAELVDADQHDGRVVTVRGLEIVGPAGVTAPHRTFWARPTKATVDTDASRVLLVLPPEATADQPIDPRYDFEAGDEVEVVASLSPARRLAPTVAGESGRMALRVRTIDRI